MEQTEEKRYCQCGCGGELKVWSNGTTSPFLRGHHMRKKGWIQKISGTHYCQCGCGSEIKPLAANGHIRKFLKGHHLKGKRLSLEYRLQRTKSRWGKDPVLSPYIPETIITFERRVKRWTACIKDENGKSFSCLHANAVYRHHFGVIPEGYVIHHKSGKHNSIEDDAPENLIAIPDEWNLRFFPVIAKGFGVEEKLVTDAYIKLLKDNNHDTELFANICLEIDKARKQH